MNKTVDCYTSTPLSHIFDWVPDSGVIKTALDYTVRYDGLIFLDFTEYTRISGLTKNHEDRFDTHQKIIIDHHEVVATTPCTISYIVPDITSTCELMYEILCVHNRALITPDVATYLYLGLTTDTGNYIYDGNNIATLQRGIDLVSRGANKYLVQHHMLRSLSFSALRFLWCFLNRIVQVGSVYYSYYSDDDLELYQIDKEQAEIGTHTLQQLEWSDVIIVFKVRWDYIYFSLRSRSTPIDHIARHYGGGWHKYSSGWAMVPRTNDVLNIQLESIVNNVLWLLAHTNEYISVE